MTEPVHGPPPNRVRVGGWPQPAMAGLASWWLTYGAESRREIVKYTGFGYGGRRQAGDRPAEWQRNGQWRSGKGSGRNDGIETATRYFPVEL
jgi:hypothetical protein